jgi:uncharacterized MnhB-related membrane protein
MVDIFVILTFSTCFMALFVNDTLKCIKLVALSNLFLLLSLLYYIGV